MELTKFISGYYYSATISYENKVFKLLIFGNNSVTEGQKFVQIFNTTTVKLYNSTTPSLTLTPIQLYHVVSECLVGKGLMSVRHDKSYKFINATFNFSYFGEAVSIHFEIPKIDKEVDYKNENEELKAQVEDLKNKLNDYKFTPAEYQQKIERLEDYEAKIATLSDYLNNK